MAIAKLGYRGKTSNLVKDIIVPNACKLSLDFGQKEKIVSVIITLTKSGNVPLSPVNLITEK